MSNDEYEIENQLITDEFMAEVCEDLGDFEYAHEIRERIKAQRMEGMKPQYDAARACQAATKEETLDNIKAGVLKRIRNEEEYARWIYEELDAAYIADYGYNLNTRDFALNSGISPEVFRGTLDSESSIDGAEGPQQFINAVMDYFFSQDRKDMVVCRIKIVSSILKEGFEKGIFKK